MGSKEVRNLRSRLEASRKFALFTKNGETIDSNERDLAGERFFSSINTSEKATATTPSEPAAGLTVGRDAG